MICMLCVCDLAGRHGGGAGDLTLNVRRVIRGGLDSEEDMDVTSETSETTPE